MTEIPQTAIEAAQGAFARVYNDPATMAACITAAIEAAAPLIAAAERERIIALAGERDARYPVSYTAPDGDLNVGYEPFAGLLRVPDAEA